MTLSDTNLAALVARLKPSERQAVEEAVKGKATDESAVILRWLRKKLKGKARRGKKRR